MATNPHRSLLSVEEYLELDRTSPDARYEYIDGRVYMLAGGTANHSIISANIISELRLLLRGKRCRVYTSDMRVQLSSRRYVYPDVTVSCDERDRGQTDMLRYPHLVVEVLSSSTEAYDRGRKAAYYRQCPTIQEYVLVDAQQPYVEVYRRETENLWTLRSYGQGEQIELASLQLTIPLAALYEDVILPEDTEHIE